MQKRKWRVCVLALFAVMINGVFFTSCSEQLGDITENLQYQKIEGKDEWRVTGLGTISAKSVVIPTRYLGFPVTEIGNAAFQGEENLESITFSNKVRHIGEYAFEDCDNLTAVAMGDGVLSIGDYAFSGCDSLSVVEFGDNVTTLGEYSFRDCDGLERVDIPDKVTSVGVAAFAYCDHLTMVSIGNGVTVIGANAFDSCGQLADVKIGSSVATIGDYAFSRCDSLSNLYYMGTVGDWKTIEINLSTNDCLTKAIRYYYSESEIGAWWHYDAQGNIVTSKW